MIKKLLLTLILVVMVIGQASAEQRFYMTKPEKFYNSKYYSEAVYILIDKKYNVEYLIVENQNNIGKADGIAITPLIKPAVYVHKGGKR